MATVPRFWVCTIRHQVSNHSVVIMKSVEEFLSLTISASHRTRATALSDSTRWWRCSRARRVPPVQAGWSYLFENSPRCWLEPLTNALCYTYHVDNLNNKFQIMNYSRARPSPCPADLGEDSRRGVPISEASKAGWEDLQLHGKVFQHCSGWPCGIDLIMNS